ncbi:MAG: MlaD family protein [Mycobacteriaceae bacterium]
MGNKKVQKAALALSIMIVICFCTTTLIIRALKPKLPSSMVTYSAVFDDTSGLLTGDSVRQSGVLIGEVKSIHLVNNKAEVNFSVGSDHLLSTTSIIAVRFQNLLGQRYLDIESALNVGKELPPNSLIGSENTVSSFDITDIFNGFEPLFSSMSPDSINRFGENLLALVQGDGTGVEQVIGDIDSIAELAVRKQFVLELIIKNLGKIAEDISGKSEQFNVIRRELNKVIELTSSKVDELLTIYKDMRQAFSPLSGLVKAIEKSEFTTEIPFEKFSGLGIISGDQLLELTSVVPGLANAILSVSEGKNARFHCKSGEEVIAGIGELLLVAQGLQLCKA